MTSRHRLLAVTLSLLAASAAADEENSHIGLRVGYQGSAEKGFLGGEFLVPAAAHSRYWLCPNLEYLKQGDVNHFSINLDVLGDLPWRVRERYYGWLGAGLGLLVDDPVGRRDTTAHSGVINMMAGVGRDGPAIPYLQLKLTLRRSRLVPWFGFGVRF